MEKNGVLIEFSDVSLSFGNKNVLDNINLKIHEGDIFGLLGRSGSGKTTLLKMLLGIYRPDSGKILFRDKEIAGDSLRKIVGLTTQENSFYDKLTVYENMRYYANLYRVKEKKLGQHIKNILKLVGLESAQNTQADRISGGMKRRLDFAISILHDPMLLILDEPTTGLDPIIVKQFWEIVKDVSKKGKTILVISHIFPEIKENCNKACILHKGQALTITINPKTDLYDEFVKAHEGHNIRAV
jgi:ABC-2 type transport system ATP-binding protein